VEWINKDIVDHTATARNKAWDVKIPTGKTGRLTLEKAGTFEYYCTLHPNMVGKLIVRR
jgi:plastocyanin